MDEIAWIFFWLYIAVGVFGSIPDVRRFWTWVRIGRRQGAAWYPRSRPRVKWRTWSDVVILWSIVYLVIGVALQVLGYLLAPKPKGPKPNETQDLEDPVAEAGKPIPVVFGTVIVKGVNCVWFGDKRKIRYKVKP